MLELIAAAAAFVLIHLLISGTRARDRIVGVVGEGAFMGLFSAASAGVLIWMIFAFHGAKADPANQVFWSATAATRAVQMIVQLLAFQFAVIGLTTPNPTSVGQVSALDRPDPVRGMLRVTRHPFLWGVALWAAGHLLVNGDVAGVVLFVSMLALAVLGTRSIDAKRLRALGETYAAFMAVSSNTPFAAILTGRQNLKLGEIGWIRPLAALIVWGAIFHFHANLFGVSRLP